MDALSQATKAPCSFSTNLSGAVSIYSVYQVTGAHKVVSLFVNRTKYSVDLSWIKFNFGRHAHHQSLASMKALQASTTQLGPRGKNVQLSIAPSSPLRLQQQQMQQQCQKKRQGGLQTTLGHGMMDSVDFLLSHVWIKLQIFMSPSVFQTPLQKAYCQAKCAITSLLHLLFQVRLKQYPLANKHKTMENHHVQWENSLFQ